jgi:hypothetical protein
MDLHAHCTARSARLRPRLLLVAFCFAAFGATRSAIAQTSISPLDPLAQRVADETLALNYVWTLVAGFLVMFMQAGFALIETGMCRAKNAAHTMSMNMLVYAASMAGFWVCGFAFMCGGVNGIPDGPGGPATLALDHVRALSNMGSISLAGHSWGILGFSGFFLLGGVHRSVGALVWFFYMMVFMDTAATIPTGTLAERWKFKSFAVFSICVGALHLSRLRLLDVGRRMAGAAWEIRRPGARRDRFRRLVRRASPGRCSGLGPGAANRPAHRQI